MVKNDLTLKILKMMYFKKIIESKNIIIVLKLLIFKNGKLTFI